MSIENKGPGGVGNSYGARSTQQPTKINSTSPKGVYNEFDKGAAATFSADGTSLVGVDGETWTLYKSVKDFGAKCDGVTDDSAAFALAIASSTNEIIVPDNCVANVVLNKPKKLRGDGRREVSITAANPALPTLLVSISRDTNLVGPCVSDISCINPTGSKAIELINAHDWRLDNVRAVAPAGTGLTLDGSWNGCSTAIEVKGCVTGIDIIGNVFSNNSEQNVPCDFYSAFIANNQNAVKIRSAASTSTSPGIINFYGGDIESNSGLAVSVEQLCILNLSGVHFEANAGGDILSTNTNAVINIFGCGYKFTKISGNGFFNVDGIGITSAQASDKVWMDASEMNSVSIRGLRLVPFTSIDSTGIAAIKSTRRHFYGIAGKNNLIINGHFAVNATASGWVGYGQSSAAAETKLSYSTNNINPSGPGRIVTIDGSSWGTFVGIQQLIRRYSNGLVTISFWAKTDSTSEDWRFVSRNTATPGAYGYTNKIASTVWTYYIFQYYVYDDPTHSQMVAFWTNSVNSTNKLYIAEFCVTQSNDAEGFNTHYTE